MEKETLEKYYECERSEMLEFIPLESKKILELGCANGRFSSSIKDRQSVEIWGIEYNAEAAANAAKRLDKVINDDIANALDELPLNYFDCVVCNDILEHLPDPVEILKSLRKHITNDGVLVSSIPNVRYLPVLYEILIRKDFKYRDSGVLDNTHLRFFTNKSIIRLFDLSGYKVMNIKGLKAAVPFLYKCAFLLVNILTLGYYKDSSFIQFASVAKKV